MMSPARRSPAAAFPCSATCTERGRGAQPRRYRGGHHAHLQPSRSTEAKRLALGWVQPAQRWPRDAPTHQSPHGCAKPGPGSLPGGPKATATALGSSAQPSPAPRAPSPRPVTRPGDVPTEQDPSRRLNRICSPEHPAWCPPQHPSPGPRGTGVGAVGGSYLGDGERLPKISPSGDAEAPGGRAGQGHCHRHGRGWLWAGKEPWGQEAEAEESPLLPPRSRAHRRPSLSPSPTPQKVPSVG